MVMIKRHKYVGADFNDDQTIWKYFSFNHFVEMIKNHTLYMGRADFFEDKRELLATELNAKCYRIELDKFQNLIDRDKPISYFNCWTMLEHESYLMWKAYSNLENGIVIRSTAKRLMDSYKGSLNITIGKVDYINENTKSSQPQGKPLNWLYLVYSKLWYYDDEKELRLFFYDTKRTGKNTLHIDLNTLISEIRVAPKMQQEQFDEIRQKVYDVGLKCPVLRSEIDIKR